MSRCIVVVPTYNECENLPLLVPQVLAQDARIEVLVVMSEWAVPQPINEFVQVRRAQYFFQCFKAAAKIERLARECKQVQIVITQNRYSGITETSNEAQRFQGFWPAVDQIAR